ncbi:histidine--tRNA ligase [Candidatus Gracilibacteria bacterium]|nr:histidine--tRNA ligase [Candidatus Gracilibacteria bacterium]
MQQLPNTPPKGTSDWFPEEFKVRKHIFDTWRQVCLSYGFEEYLGPMVESIDIWKAKSGEDVGGSELTEITDRNGELSGLAIRPEMTPTVTRMVSRKWKEIEKPVKWFSIANFYRNEKPQKGRNREFWQLNADIFGEESLRADIEALTLSLELLRAFNPPVGSYKLKINHRQLISGFLSEVLGVADIEQQKSITRLLDKYEKLKRDDFKKLLLEINESIDMQSVEDFMEAKNITDLQKSFKELSGSESFVAFKEIIETLGNLGYAEEIEFSGSLIRGFDYYDGMIFEMFDTNTDNPRALFGGGRYNGLADIFGVKGGISAVGFAPGDETMKLFLEGHDLLSDIQNEHSKKYYFPLLEEELFENMQILANTLRKQGKNVLLGLSPKKLGKAIQAASKSNYSHIVIFGVEEKTAGIMKIKNLKTGEEETYKI